MQEFNTLINPVKEKVSKLFKIELNTDSYDLILVKKLAKTNTLTDSGSSNQSHIALTGDERHIFPAFFNIAYVNEGIKAFKRYFLLKIPVILKKENLNYLEQNFGNALNQDLEVYTTTSIGIHNQEQQLEIGDIGQDHEQWTDFRKLLKEGDVIVFIKYKGELKYLAFALKKEDIVNLEFGCGFAYMATNQTPKIAKTLIDISNNVQSITLNIHPLNQILFGAAGTGKSYNTINYAVAILENVSIDSLDLDREKVKSIYDNYIQNGQIDFVTFHQSYSYEEFIEGIKPEIAEGGVTYHVQDGTFKKMCQVAESNPEKDFVFIIDEINRGNISKIFGELITLIEDSKRIGQAEALQIKLAYSGSGDNPKLFGVPQNLYIIGTMNTADRSIALLDTALRRRFKFIEYKPKPELLSTDLEGINLQTLLTNINQRLEFLLDKDHAIGHAYFLKVQTKNDLCKVFKNNIIPQLEEFFYNDYDKIQLVLGDNDKWKGNKDDLKLILKTGKVNSNAVFGEDLDILEGKAIYEMNSNLKNDNFESIKPEVFISIYQKP
jgi:AAA domain (dynein-related subfamily)